MSAGYLQAKQVMTVDVKCEMLKLTVWRQGSGLFSARGCAPSTAFYPCHPLFYCLISCRTPICRLKVIPVHTFVALDLNRAGRVTNNNWKEPLSA